MERQYSPGRCFVHGLCVPLCTTTTRGTWQSGWRAGIVSIYRSTPSPSNEPPVRSSGSSPGVSLKSFGALSWFPRLPAASRRRGPKRRRHARSASSPRTLFSSSPRVQPGCSERRHLRPFPLSSAPTIRQRSPPLSIQVQPARAVAATRLPGFLCDS